MSETLTPVDKNTGELQFTSGKDGTPQIDLSIDEIPQFLFEAHSAIEAGRIDKAGKLLNKQNIETIRRMVETDTCRTDVMFMVARMLFCVRDFHNSEIWFKEVLKRQPHAPVYYELGRICKLSGRPTEEVQYRRRASEAAPENTDIFIQFILSVIHTGDVEQAIDILKKKLKTDPANKTKA